MRISDWSSDVCSSDLAGSGKDEWWQGARERRLKAEHGLDVAVLTTRDCTFRRPRLTLTRRLVGAAEAAPTDLGLLSLLLTLNLTFGAPPKRRSRRIRPAGRRTWMCGGFREGRMAFRKIAPVPRTRRTAPG